MAKRRKLYQESLDQVFQDMEFKEYVDRHYNYFPISTTKQIDQRIGKQQFFTFLCGTLDPNSSISSFFKDPICDSKNLFLEIASFLVKQ